MKRIAVVAALWGAAACSSPAHAQTASVTLEWTAPGDDGNVGTASLYAARWNRSRPDTTRADSIAAWWGRSTPIVMPNPTIAGTTQTVSVAPPGGFAAGSTYYFAMYAEDEVGNRSALSNVAWITVTDTTAPSCPCNLKVKVP
jgi:hypothetical protein